MPTCVFRPSILDGKITFPFTQARFLKKLPEIIQVGVRVRDTQFGPRWTQFI